MKKRFTMSVGLTLLAFSLTGLSACCGGSGNAEKTAECKEKKNSDDCKACCGGNFSYLGECTCY